jgi:5'-3' exonuclease
MNKYDGIKQLRAKTGYGLRESMQLIDKYGSVDAALAALATPTVRAAHEAQQDEVIRLHQENHKLAQRLKLAIDILDFYGRMMGRKSSNGEPFYMNALDLDCGDRARETSAKLKSPL